jgi:ABC-type uncharacterized transport system permease subunit
MVIGFLAIIFYFLATVGYYQLAQEKLNSKHNKSIALIAWAAIICHTFDLYQQIELAKGQDLNFFNMLSMATWLGTIVLWTNQFRQKSQALLLIALPSTATVLLLNMIVNPQPVIFDNKHVGLLLHIFSSILAYTMLALACIQAILLWFLDYKLRKAPGTLSPLFPPLQAVETYLFQLIWLGFIFLTTSLALALFTMTDVIHTIPLHKPLLTGISWIIFGSLLLGRYLLGWRGKIAVKYTLSGFSLLLLGYFGTKFVVEYIIN